MLNGVKGLLELAGGGSWSKGARLLSSLLDCNTEPAFMSLLEVIAVPKNRCFPAKLIISFKWQFKRPKVFPLVLGVLVDPNIF